MFTNPLLLWGLFFVFIPLVIHLINLLRFRQVDWGAMEFLLTAYRKHRTRVRMKELLLLLMRVILIALPVLLLAGPTLRGFLPGGSKVHHVIVLDDSFSMADRMGEGSAFENAQISIQKLLDELSQQAGAHSLTFLRTSQVHENTRKADIHDQRISRNFRETFSPASLKPTYFPEGLPEALSYAAELVPESIEGNRIFYVISDFRHRDWHENPALVSQFRKFASEGIQLRLIDCAPAEHPNLTLSALKPLEGIRAAGVPLLMSVRVTNFGISPARNTVLHPEIFLVGEEEKKAESGQKAETAASLSSDPSSSAVAQALPAITVEEIPPGESVTATFPVTFPLAGNYGVRVSLPPDALAEDNQAFASLFIPPFEPVLIIDDSLDASTSRFLRTALSPGERVQTGLVPRVEKARFLSTNDLNAFRSIYLLDVTRLEPQAVSALEQFVKNGGGLCVFTGPNTEPINAQKWFRDGKGFFPVLLDQMEELPRYYASPDIRVAPHPIFRLFSGESEALFNSIHVERYFTLDDSSLEKIIPLQDETALTQKSRQKEKENLNDNSPAGTSPEDLSENSPENSPETGMDTLGDVHVIAALRNNAPLVLERKYGQGKIVLFLTTADRTWTDWPVGDPSRPNPFTQGSFVVMVLQLQAFLTQEQFFFWQVGDSLMTSFRGNEFEGTASFFNPDATLWERPAAIASQDGKLEISTSPVPQPGVFWAELKGLEHSNEKRLFAVNVDQREGDLKKISREELARTFENIPFDFVLSEKFHFKADDTGRSPLSDWILVFMLIWIILEMLMAASASWHLGSGSMSRQYFSRTAMDFAERNIKSAKRLTHGGEK
ncbi:MAG: hypothetical protein E7028_10390 [Planctomycetaceae bacterium]|nr:hypothetical protein [Planctomycetaceae bacterium]